MPEFIEITSNFKQDADEKRFGFLEKLHGNGITGWIIDMENSLAGKKVKISIGDQYHAEGFVDLPRGDLQRKFGFYESSGFNLLWKQDLPGPETIDEDKEYRIVFEHDGQKTVFTNFPSITGKELKGIMAKAFAANRPVTPQKIKEYFEEKADKVDPGPKNEDGVKLIAYYLPQFHPFVENDEWWGPGFTEWTNVSQGKSYFKGHYQPHIPGELGFYDLRLPETREAQAKLAREYGIYGFCYYYYWFKGRRLMDRPLMEVFESGKPDFPFCICWANETWSRRWDGSEEQILIKQEHLPETDEHFIYDVIPFFKDPRYIRLNGAPLLIIYNAKLIPHIRETIKSWRRICAENGIEKLHVSAAETFGFNSPYDFGFDSGVQFPPHGLQSPPMNEKIEDLPDDYGGNIYDYWDCVRRDINMPATYKRFPGIMTSWDNTSRRKKNGNIFLGATPELYEVWLRAAIDNVKQNLPAGERCVFINAWNEWAEGTHLEPDRKYGRKWLEATRRALAGSSNWEQLIKYAERLETFEGKAKDNILKNLQIQLMRMQMQLNWYEDIFGGSGIPKEWTRIKPGCPRILSDEGVCAMSMFCIEQINMVHNPVFVPVDKSQKMFIVGWSLAQGMPILESTPTYLLLRNADTNEIAYHGFIYKRMTRNDVSGAYKNFSSNITKYSGIRSIFDIGKVDSGLWKICVLTVHENGLSIANSNVTIEVE